MPQFTSSAKTLTSYIQTEAVDTLVESFGSRLQGLSKHEKYQVCADIARALEWYLSSDNPSGDKTGYFSDCRFSMSNQGQAIDILQNEPVEILAQLLPAIAEYARDDDR